MSDYRYQIVKHNDIDCLHVMIDAEPIAETHIPLDDIVFSALSQGYVMSQELLQKLAQEHIRSEIENGSR